MKNSSTSIIITYCYEKKEDLLILQSKYNSVFTTHSFPGKSHARNAESSYDCDYNCIVYLNVYLSPLGQDDRHCEDDIFRYIFIIENFCAAIKILLQFVPQGPIDNNPALV